ncbi:ASC1-like protein [Lolium rigidum]|uniref:ASC1-like protein n=1 Tax=Lolium rigidum TaxID=89674 RepID=UPI001F5D058C|nr:ASC1-like protein [Lolium rigidum]
MVTLVGLFMRCYSSSLLVDWEAEADPAYGDYAVLPILAAFFPALRFLLDRFLFEELARRLIFGKGYGNLTETDERIKKIDKFKESAWKFVYYLSAELLTLSATYNEPWFTCTRCFWVGPGDLLWPDQKINLRLLHMYATGFNIYSIFALLFWETRRKVFGIMMINPMISCIISVMKYL